MRSRLRASTLVVALATALAGCAKSDAVEFMMRGAPRAEVHPPSLAVPLPEGRLMLAGDLHCHVLPPDAPYHVSRELADTVELATRERLDFVMLTPHVPARFFANPAERRWVVRTQRELRARLAAIPRAEGAPLFVPGFEYTDHRYGHVGAGFAEVEETLAALEARGADLTAHPEAFFEDWVARGGLLVVNHPVQRPMPGAPVLALRYDMSFRALLGLPAPPEMRWIAEHAQGYETFNASISHLRDLLFFEDEARSTRAASHLLDVAARARGPARLPLAAVGGSDSHDHWLRATTWVLSRARRPEAIRDAIAEGRTCVGGPETCTLQARPAGDLGSPWRGIGDELPAGLDAIDVRAGGSGPTTLVVDGAVVGHVLPGDEVRLAVHPGRCTLLRAVQGASWSSHVRVGCAR